MPEDASEATHKHVTLIPTDRIRVLNPRVRNRRHFEEIVDNIARVKDEIRKSDCMVLIPFGKQRYAIIKLHRD